MGQARGNVTRPSCRRADESSVHAFRQGGTPGAVSSMRVCPSSGVAMTRRRLLPLALSLVLAGGAHAQAAVPPPQDVPYAPGMMKVEVDATNLSQRIFSIKQT